MKLLIVSIIMIALAFAMIAIRLLLIKKGQFKGTCASQNPFLGNEESCSLCGRKPAEEECGKVVENKN